MRYAMLIALLLLSPLSALADSVSGQISVSLTILPGCKIEVLANHPRISCTKGALSQPHISQTLLAGHSTLMTIEW
ncbi:MAG: hypothetical protein P4L95_17495 [Rouxiella aceris]|uniref:hypothetical protein n=1 Tax=Rouxiella aceris TaxID=2703884 RepID=UPI002850E075|nr:hypothetical protein [Rouxiella aceris]MDR3433670.1 hypothetical protein [Rouxiella aceris]